MGKKIRMDSYIELLKAFLPEPLITHFDIKRHYCPVKNLKVGNPIEESHFFVFCFWTK